MTEVKDNVKEAQLLAAGKQLFWKYGIKRVSVEEICTEAGVSKMTFYRYFGNKKEIAKRIFMKLNEEETAKYYKIMNSDLPFPEKINRAVQLEFEATKELSQEFLMDILKSKDENLLNYIEETQKETINFFLQILNKAQENGEVRADIKPETFIYFMKKIPELLVDEKLLGLYENTQDAIMGVTNFFYYGIGLKNAEEIR